jgi:SAM-dependent methyltransferase
MNDIDTLRLAYDKYAAERDAKDQMACKVAERAPFLARLQAGATLLDLGAGPGADAQYFADQGLSVLAVDLSPENVRRCEAKGVRAQVATFADVPQLGRFDAVWAMTSLLHAPKADLDGILADIAACLNPGGLLLLGMWGGDEEGLYEDDRYEPKRFFALWPLDELAARVAEHFEVVEARQLVVEGTPSPFQIITARRR